jgi:hypothetical protein
MLNIHKEIENQNNVNILPHSCQNVTIKKINNKYFQGCGEKGMLKHCYWECKLVHHCGKQHRGSSKKKK